MKKRVIKKKKKKNAMTIVKDSMVKADEVAAEKKSEEELSAAKEFVKKHPAVEEDLAAAILFSESLEWTDDVIYSVADGCEEEISEIRQDFPWLTEAEAVRYLYDPRLKWKGKPDANNKETWFPILCKDGSIDRLPPQFASNDLITDYSSYDRLIEAAGKDEKRIADARRRYFDAIKRDGYAKSRNWVPLWPPVKK